MHCFRYCSFLLLAAAVAQAANPPAPAPAAKEIDPLAVLKSDAPKAEKAMACKRLAISGKADAVPALAALLSDPQLSSWARIALEAIPGEAAGAALREALDKVQGPQRLGVINSIAVRRDAKAIDALAARLKDADAEVASASTVALGKIGGQTAARALKASLATAPEGVRSAVAEGCIVCAERLAAAGQDADALLLFGAVTKASVPVQRVLEATRGLILVHGPFGTAILREQLQSAEKGRFALGLRVARELPGSQVTQMLLAELDKAPAPRQALLILALADRGDKTALPAVLQATKAGAEGARVAALRALQRLGDKSCVPVLLDAAADANDAVARAAIAALVDLPGADIDKELSGRVVKAEGRLRRALVEVAGRRPIPGVTAALCKAAADPDPVTRAAAFKALGATIEFAELDALLQGLAKVQDKDEAAVADGALVAACTDGRPGCHDREAAGRHVVGRYAGAVPHVGGPDEGRRPRGLEGRSGRGKGRRRADAGHGQPHVGRVAGPGRCAGALGPGPQCGGR